MSTSLAPNHQRIASLRSFLIRLLLAFSDIYGIGTIAFVLVRLATGYQFWPINVAGYILHLVLLPGFVVLPLMIWKSQWKRAALSGATIAIFLVLFGELFLPSFSSPNNCTATDPDCSPRLIVMTFNLAAGATNDDRLIAMLRDSGADIIGIQEFDPADAKLIKDQLSDLYPYQIQQGESYAGTGMLSRFPITRHVFFLPPSQGFLYVEAEVDVNGKSIRVVVAHPPPMGQVPETGAILSRTITDTPLLIELMTKGGPALLLGDLNITDQNEEYTLLRQAGLIDSWREEGWGFGPTFPVAQDLQQMPVPLYRIDYIWHTADFNPQRVWTGPQTGSDHLPVLAELAFEK